MSNGKKQFAQWLKRNDPFLYGVAVKRFQREQQGLSGFTDFFSSVLETVKVAAPQVLQYRQQKKIMDMQMDRAKRDLPPLDATAYSPSVTISPQITPETERAMTRVAIETTKQAGNDMKKYLIPAGLGLAALLFLKKRGR